MPAQWTRRPMTARERMTVKARGAARRATRAARARTPARVTAAARPAGLRSRSNCLVQVGTFERSGPNRPGLSFSFTGTAETHYASQSVQFVYGPGIGIGLRIPHYN